MNRQERMYQIITGLGVKPTGTKTNLPTLKMPHIDSIKELKDKVESLTIHDKENATASAENEIHKIKEDLIMEKAGVISYKILLHLAEQTNIQDLIDTLKQNLEEEQSMSDWIIDNASAMIDELWPKIESSIIE